MKTTFCFCLIFLSFWVFRSKTEAQALRKIEADICVYEATGAGVLAAVAAAREGQSVIIIEPTHKIGGLLGTGFRMQQDVPYPDHLGGLTGDFYQEDIKQPKPRHPQGSSKNNIRMLQDLITNYGKRITVITDHRLASVKTGKGIIREALFEYAPPGKDGVPLAKPASGALINVTAKVFIDASYEGDLMAQSGVSYRIGKESKADYGESLAGIVLSKKFTGVDPYVEKGNPKSGLLSGIQADPLGKEGDSSRFFMGYNFKLAWEKEPTEAYPGIPIPPPAEKNKDVYELLKRAKEAGYELTWPEENFRRNELMTGAIPGMQMGYPDGSWAQRAKIWRGYIEHIKTLNDFAEGHVRLLSANNEDTNGWPSYLYIRGGRRLIGEYVMTQKDIQLQTKVPTPIGMGYYKVDIYPNRLVVLDDGTLAQEGNVFATIAPGPYQLPYGAIIPQKKQCTNLIVPVCMSASHVAYSSIRMESTYMVMGEAAGLAAALAIKSKRAVQDISRADLTARLQTYGAKLAWDGKGYRVWRYNVFSKNPTKENTRWETNPEEYKAYPISVLWK